MKVTDRMAEILEAAGHRRVRRNVHTGSAWYVDWFVPVTPTVKALQRRGLAVASRHDDFEFLILTNAGREYLKNGRSS